MDYEISCMEAESLNKWEFDDIVAQKLPKLLMRILNDPLCHDSSGYQQQLADVLLDLRKFIVFYENDSLTRELIQYHLLWL